MRSWYHILEWRAAQLDDQLALVDDTGARYTYAELKEAVEATAGGWHARGVGTDDTVAIMARNSADYLIQVLGLARVGALPALLNWRLLEKEVGDLLALLSPTAIVADEDFAPVLDGTGADVGVTVVRGSAGSRWTPLDELAGPAPPVPVDRLRSGSHFVVMHTSGTTGRPKLIPLTYAGHIGGCLNAVLNCPDMKVGSRHLRSAPLFHLAGLSGVLLGLLTGGEVYFKDRFDPDDVLDTIERESIEFTNGGPTVQRMLLQAYERRTRKPDLSSLREMWYGNSPMPPSLLSEAMTVFPCRFRQNYGMTESQSPVTQLEPADHETTSAKLHTAGRPRSGWEVQVVGPDDHPLPPGTTGEVWIRGEYLFPGYWHDHETTRAVFVHDADATDLPWFRTGDLGSLDADGYLSIVGRAKEMIITGGENVYPAEVEAVLLEHADLAEIAVIGLPHERWGETVAAVVVPCRRSFPTESDVIDFARSRLAHFKCPTSVTFVDDLPRNASGKVLKRTLERRFDLQP